MAARSISQTIGDFFAAAESDLRLLASALLRRERRGHTLQTTALIHEALLRLFRSRSLRSQDRAGWFAAVAATMRRVLLDHAKSRSRAKRGGLVGRSQEVNLSQLAAKSEKGSPLASLDRALEELARFDPRAAKIVEYRFFAGLSETEIAETLGFSRRTVSKDWKFARAWLRERIEQDGAADLI